MERSIPTVIGALLAALPALLTPTNEAAAKAPRVEALPVPSLTLTDEQLLGGDKASGVTVTLTGELRIPDSGDKLPALVLLHTSGGFGDDGAEFQWRNFLNGMGIATFRLDSFSARGIDGLSTNQAQLPHFVQLYDAYRAVDVLAIHPRIDPTRIAIMGFSRGATAALYASQKRFLDLYGPAKTSIAAFLPFYPRCNYELVGELDVSDAPIREFHGAADDWTPAAPCRDYVARLSATGKDATITEFVHALHNFDNPYNSARDVIDQAQTVRKCRLREEAGRIVNAETGKVFTYADACVEHGPAVGFDEAATKAAQAAVKEFLTGLFDLH